MAEVNINLKCDLQHAVKVQYLDGNLFSQDAAANTINIEVTDNGAPATIGGTVSANVIRPDGGTVAVTGGTISGNIVSITLPAACYALVGMITIVVKLTDSSVVTTLAAAVAYVYQSSTDTAVDPGTIIPSIEDLIDAIDTAVASIPADYSSLWTSLAPAFSSSTAYTAGQYVTYNSGLYRFTKAHAAGSWASGDVVAVNIGGELSDLKSALEVTRTDSVVPFPMTVERFGITESNGADNTNANYIRTKGFLALNGSCVFKKAENSLAYIFTYNLEGVKQSHTYLNASVREYVFTADSSQYKYRISYAHSPVEPIDLSNADEFYVYQQNDVYARKNELNATEDETQKMIVSGEAQFDSDTFVRGGLEAGVLNTNVKYRVSSANICTAYDDLIIAAKPGFKISVHLFSAGTYTGYHGWLTEYTVPKDQQYKLMIARETENTSEIADIPTFVQGVYIKSFAMNHTTFEYSMDCPLNRINGYVKHGTGEYKSSQGTHCYTFANNGITHLKVFTSSDVATIDAIAFFSGDSISEDTYISASSVAWGGNLPNGQWYEADVPAEASLIAVSVIWYRSPYAKPQIIFNLNELMGVLETSYGKEISRIDSAITGALTTAITSGDFRYIYHFGMEYVTNRPSIPPLIPSQSIFDVQNAKNLGFDCIEANVHKTSDDHYVVTHGVNGKLGHDFDDLNGDDAGDQDIVISENTLSDLQTNYRYRSSNPDYRVPITTLEDFLSECARVNLKVMLMYRDNDSMQLALNILGKNRVFMYNAPRSEYDGPITNYRSYTSKAAIVADCELFGVPYIYSMANTGDFTADELKDIAETLHNMGYQLMTAYKSNTVMSNLASYGWDYFILGDNTFREPVVINGKQINFNNDGSVTWTDVVPT